MSAGTIDRHLNVVRIFARQLRSAENEVDQRSLVVANHLLVLFRSKWWVNYEREAVLLRGRPVDPESKAQFAKWALTWTGLGTSYTLRLLRAAAWLETYGALFTAKLAGERAVRPWYKMEQLTGFEDEIEAVGEAASALASDGVITASEMREAVREFAEGQCSFDFDPKRAKAVRLEYQIRTALEGLADLGAEEQLRNVQKSLDELTFER